MCLFLLYLSPLRIFFNVIYYHHPPSTSARHPLYFLVSFPSYLLSLLSSHSERRGTPWAKWFLLAGLVPLIFVMTSLINLNRYKKLRLIMPVIIGTFLGLCILLSLSNFLLFSSLLFSSPLPSSFITISDISGSFVPLPPPRTAYSTAVPFGKLRVIEGEKEENRGGKKRKEIREREEERGSKRGRQRVRGKLILY